MTKLYTAGDKVQICIPNGVKQDDRIDGGLVVVDRIFAKDGQFVEIVSVSKRDDGSVRYATDAGFYISPSLIKPEKLSAKDIKVGMELVVDISGTNRYSYNMDMLRLHGQIVKVKDLGYEGTDAIKIEEDSYIYVPEDLRFVEKEDVIFNKELQKMRDTVKNLESEKEDVAKFAKRALAAVLDAQAEKARFKIALVGGKTNVL